MSVLTSLLVALPTVFAAAFLAMMLENVRERIRTRRWVLRNLRILMATTDTTPPEAWTRVETAVQRWLDAESPEDMDEDAWRLVRIRFNSTVPDISPLLRSEAATSVSAELFAAVYELEQEIITVREASAAHNAQVARDVLPLWYERRVPLKDADARRVAAYLEGIRALRRAAARFDEVADRFRDLVRSGPRRSGT